MSKFTPYVLQQTHSTLREKVLVCRASWAGAVVAVSRRLWYPVVGEVVVERVIPAHNLPGSFYPTYKVAEETPWIQLASELKEAALEYGGSPEAVLLLHSLIPFTQKEQDQMAKAATKPAKKAAAAEAAPKAARKGNPEALKKAREAKAAAGPDTRKLTITNKENPYREGSNRAASFDALKGAKTVQDYIDAGGKAKYISRWVEEGRISVK